MLNTDDGVDTLPMFDIAPHAGGRAVDETRAPTAKHNTDPRRRPCDRCGQQVLPGPHTRPDGARLCEKDPR